MRRRCAAIQVLMTRSAVALPVHSAWNDSLVAADVWNHVHAVRHDTTALLPDANSECRVPTLGVGVRIDVPKVDDIAADGIGALESPTMTSADRQCRAFSLDGVEVEDIVRLAPPTKRSLPSPPIRMSLPSLPNSRSLSAPPSSNVPSASPAMTWRPAPSRVVVSLVDTDRVRTAAERVTGERTAVEGNAFRSGSRPDCLQ